MEMEGEMMQKHTKIRSLLSHMRQKGGTYLTVSWMLNVTRGPGEAASTRMSGKSSASPILEL